LLACGRRGTVAGMAAHLERRIRKLQGILDVAKAMAAERDLDALLGLILRLGVFVESGTWKCALR